MKILVASSIPPRRAGDGAQLQVAHLVSNLRRDHEVRVVFVGPDGDSDLQPFIRISDPQTSGVRDKMRRLLGILTPTPLLVRQLQSTGFADAVAAEATSWSPDCVLVTNGPAAFVANRLAGRPRVLSTIDSWSLNEQEIAQGSTGLRRWYSRLVFNRVTAFDRRFLPLFASVITVAEQDRRWMRTLAPQTPVHVISNGVDVEYFSRTRTPSVAAERPYIAFHGVMSYPPNEMACEFLVGEVMPLVWVAHPEVELRLVGRSPSDRVQALASERVIVTGPVDDLRPQLVGASVCVYPLLSGTGVKNKVLEAAALESIIVATPSAIGDLGLRDGESCRIGRTAAELAALVIEQLDTPAPRLGAAARSVVSQDHSWQHVGEAVGALCEDAVARTARTPAS